MAELRAQSLAEAWQQDQGVLLLTPHLGCWEVLGAYLGESYPVSALYDRPNLAALEKIVLDMRQRFGATMHAISGALEGACMPLVVHSRGHACHAS